MRAIRSLSPRRGAEDEYKLHLVPAGILHPNTLCVVADGVVLDPASFVGELTHLKGRGVSCENLKISGNAHVVLPYHKLLDELEEKRKGRRALGTTGRGIGPAYQDKAARVGIRMREFVDPALFAERLAEVLEFKNELLTKIYGVAPLSAEQILSDLLPHAEALRPYVDDTALRVAYAARSGKKVLFEGAQATLLDIDLGTYPYVTSSHPSAGGACIGTGLGPTQIDQIIAVSKSYTTRVGAGAFPTEQNNPTRRFDPRTRRGIRHDHGPPAPLRLAGRGRPALFVSGERPDRSVFGPYGRADRL